MDELLLFEQKNKVALLILNRPTRHNALNPELVDRFTQRLLEIESNPDIRVVLVMANGQNFSAGADIEWMQKIKQYSKDENITDAKRLAQLFKGLVQFSKPTIALVQGKTMGGGIGLLACCDIVIVEENATFCFPESKIGLIPATIAPYIIQAIGARAAKYYFLTAKFFNALEAKHLGLIHTIVKTGDLYATGMKTAGSLLKNGPAALRQIKKLVSMADVFPKEFFEHLPGWLAEIRTSDEAQEGLLSFLEKREPAWVKDLCHPREGGDLL